MPYITQAQALVREQFDRFSALSALPPTAYSASASAAAAAAAAADTATAAAAAAAGAVSYTHLTLPTKA